MLEVRDPADVRTVVAEVPAMTASEVTAAYTRARAGSETWRRTGPLDRAAVLSRGAGLIRSRAEDGAVTVVRENGKTLAEARVEVTATPAPRSRSRAAAGCASTPGSRRRR
jgi:alpha-ketoglutaric semialdehyde dehydrogenase